MFDNPGKKIKNVAMFTFVFGSIVSVTEAFILGIDHYSGPYGQSYTDFNAGIFFALFIGGPLVLYLMTLSLVAFGELVENSTKIAAAQCPATPTTVDDIPKSINEELPDL